MRLFKISAIFAALFAAATPAQAEWPEKPIEMVCATSAGSGAANWCLLMAELVGKELGTSIEVLFKPAGAGNEAATYVSERPADGYTWLQRNTSYGGYMNLPTFRPDPTVFEVPVEIEKFLYVIAVKGDSPYKTWAELIEGMKSASEPLSVAANKPGSAHHLHLVKLFEAAGVPWKYVPYNGSGGAMRDTLGGHVDLAIGPPGIWMPHVESGNARFLFLINEEKVDRKGIADLPIPSDVGMSYDIIHQIQGIFTTKDTPKEVTDKIAAAFKTVTEGDAYADYIAKNVHVVPAFSDDLEANTKRFTVLRATMKEALTEAGLLK